MNLSEKQKLRLAVLFLIAHPNRFPPLEMVCLSEEVKDIIWLCQNTADKTVNGMFNAFYANGYSLESEEHTQALEIVVNVLEETMVIV